MWIILINKSIHHEGDQRSRDCPGHGYPAYTEEVITAETFDSKDKFIERLARLDKSSTSFTSYEATKLTIKKTIQFEVENK